MSFAVPILVGLSDSRLDSGCNSPLEYPLLASLVPSLALTYLEGSFGALLMMMLLAVFIPLFILWSFRKSHSGVASWYLICGGLGLFIGRSLIQSCFGPGFIIE